MFFRIDEFAFRVYIIRIPGTKKFDFAKKVITDAVKSVKKGELLPFVMSFYSAGIEFLKTAYYANCFPAIKKKYIEK